MRKFLVFVLFLIPVLAFAGVPVAPMQNPRMQFFDSNGKPLAGGKLYFYAAGTSTPLATYTNSAGTSQNPNPVTLDAGGYGTIWMQPSAYKIIAKNSLGVQQWTVDGVNVWFATSPQTYTVATLPPSAAAGQLVTITDGNGQSCTSGSGSTVTLCQWSGITWQAIFAGNGLPDVFASQSAANPKTGAFTSISADSLAVAQTAHAKTITTIPPNAKIVTPGDSRTAGGAVGCPGTSGYSQCPYAWPAFLAAMPQFYGREWHNTAINGQTITDQAAQYATAVKSYCQAATTTAPTYLFFWILYNDLNFGPGTPKTGQQAFDLYKSYMLQAKEDGCTVVAFTDPGWTYEYVSGTHAERKVFNDLVRADTSWDKLIDLASLNWDVTDQTLILPDGIHETIAAEMQIAQYINQQFGGIPSGGIARGAVPPGDLKLPYGGIKLTRAGNGLAANSATLDYFNGLRLLATGPNASTPGAAVLTTISSDGSIQRHGVNVNAAGDVSLGNVGTKALAGGDFQAAKSVQSTGATTVPAPPGSTVIDYSSGARMLGIGTTTGSVAPIDVLSYSSDFSVNKTALHMGTNGFVQIGGTTTAGFDASGNVYAGTGVTTVYRCTTAGTLPIGALTTVAANCGASADAGLRVK